MKPRIKICCIESLNEARTAIEAGASAIGSVGRMPSGPGPLRNNRSQEFCYKWNPDRY